MLERPISKVGWTRVAFGDVVRLSKVRVADPEAAGIERVVGLEHIDPGDLRIRRWGDVADGTTFTTLFKPGQVLFGKRRAYQRKVAVADFEGVCSGDIYVLEPSNDRLMPELLPFLCQTDAFFEHAVGTSAGSLSPRTNWNSLASFEFLLPPIQEQARLVETLLAAKGSLEAYCEAQERLSSVIDSTVSAFVARWDEKNEFGRYIIDTSYGTSKKSNSDGKGVPVLGIPNVLRDELYLGDFNTVELSASEVKKLALDDGDILVVRTNGNPLYVGRSVLVESLGEKFAYASYLIRIRVDQRKITPAYAACVFGSSQMRQALRRLAKSSAGNFNLNSKDIRSIRLPVPSFEDQFELVSQVSTLRRMSKDLKIRVDAALALKRRLLEEVSS
jgi:type I restriction enzyme S subunit